MPHYMLMAANSIRLRRETITSRLWDHAPLPQGGLSKMRKDIDGSA